VRATKSLRTQFKSNLVEDLRKDQLKAFWIASSSPNTLNVPVSDKNISAYSTSIYAVIGSLRAYFQTKMFNNAFKLAVRSAYLLGRPGDLMHPIIRAIQHSKEAYTRVPSSVLYSIRSSFDFYNNYLSDETNLKSSFLGKLSFKVEPAGKIRVFAMVDCFTQWLLAPLHKGIFNFLRKIPEDATHDQDLILSTFVERIRDSKILKVYSFDLTAATDRIPVSAQALILDTMLDKAYGADWSSFLVDRWYQLSTPSWDPSAISCASLGIDPEKEKDNPYLSLKLSKPDKSGKRIPYVDAVKYATGQPMGALSSWAMLALTHHVMVRMAALRAGYREFSFYLVLGDDLVIADEKVAAHYLAIAKEWDVEINLSKSILSDNGSLEFAKRFVYKYQDVSDLSFREMAVAKHDIRGLLQLFNRITRFRNTRISELLSFLGHGYKALSRINTKYNKLSKSMPKALLLVSYPGMLFSRLSSYKEWLFSSSFNKRKENRSVLKEQLDYLKDLGRKTADSVKQSYLPRNPSEFKSFFFSILTPHNRFDPNFSQIFESESFLETWKEVGEPLQALLMPMYEEIHTTWDQTVVTVKDTFELDTMDDLETLWASLIELDDLSSQSKDASEFRPIDDIITLGSSLLLKRANVVRSHFSALAKEHKAKADKLSSRHPKVVANVPPAKPSLRELLAEKIRKMKLEGRLA
jgi:hypothetical protein